jgi:signal transduction histidine kinase
VTDRLAQLRDRLPAIPASVPRAPAFFIAGLGLLLALIWALTGGGYFWPAWGWLGLSIPLAAVVAVREVRTSPPGPRRRLETQAALSLVLVGTVLIVWALAGGGYFWPVWPMLGLAILFGLHALALMALGHDLTASRERELSERVDVLTKTRRGALDVQAAELRRIERDLHDGAQARLVALTMQLGRAEEGLADRPEAAALLRQARSEATAAIAEVRDLARGIAPPVLSDRGLPAAVAALGGRAPVPVAVDAELARRPPTAIENAAYFVVAESLTNVAKHAPEAGAEVRIAMAGERLEVEVSDDGPGGADPEGGGLSGLRQRVAALDGEMSVTSPPGGGTRIEVELPCGS